MSIILELLRLQMNHFSLAHDLGKYLGVPLVHQKASSNSFNHITTRLLQKLSTRKENSLSLAGRITLCSLVVASIPSYQMQTTFLPRPICNSIDKISCQFIWGVVEGKCFAFM